MKSNNFDALEAILNEDIDFVEKIRAISDTVKSLVHAERCSIFIHDAISKSFWSAYIEGVSYIEIPEKVGIVGKVFQSKETLIVNDVQNDANHHKTIDAKSQFITHSMIAAPIKDRDGKVVGVMQLLNKLDSDQLFTNQDIEHLREALSYIKDYISRFIK